MNPISIACIVEGHGDVEAVPIVLRRIVRELNPALTLIIPPPPIRVPRDTLLKDGEIERVVQLAALKNNGPGAVLILVDADEDCPATLGPELLARAKAARSDVPIAVVLAKWEFEAWFLAAALSLRGVQDLNETLEPPADPESVQGAKEWLRRQMPANRTYSETVDQPVLARHFDLTAARQALSFDKLYRDIDRLLQELTFA